MSFTIESARSIFPDTQVANAVPATVESFNQLRAEEQLTVLRDVVVNMGYAPTVATQKVEEPVVPPKDLTPRTKISIEGINNSTVLSYIENMNAFDFQAAVALFAEDGALQPPFEKTIVSQESILAS